MRLQYLSMSSSVFRAMLEGNFVEGSNEEVIIRDTEAQVYSECSSWRKWFLSGVQYSTTLYLSLIHWTYGYIDSFFLLISIIFLFRWYCWNSASPVRHVPGEGKFILFLFISLYRIEIQFVTKSCEQFLLKDNTRSDADLMQIADMYRLVGLQVKFFMNKDQRSISLTRKHIWLHHSSFEKGYTGSCFWDSMSISQSGWRRFFQAKIWSTLTTAGAIRRLMVRNLIS